MKRINVMISMAFLVWSFNVFSIEFEKKQGSTKFTQSGANFIESVSITGRLGPQLLTIEDHDIKLWRTYAADHIELVQSISVDSAVIDIDIADVNNDGFDDVFLLEENKLSIYMGNIDDKLNYLTEMNVSNLASILPVDVNGDGLLDILGRNDEAQQVEFWLSDSQQEFLFQGSIDANNVSDMAVQLTQEGLEVVLVSQNIEENTTQNEISFWHFFADGGFQQYRSLPVEIQSLPEHPGTVFDSIEILDVNGDGFSDIKLVANRLFVLLWGTFDGEYEYSDYFSYHSTLNQVARLNQLQFADIDNDSDLDYVESSLNSAGQQLFVRLTTKTNNIEDRIGVQILQDGFEVQRDAAAVALFDINSDGLLDIIKYSSTDKQILLNGQEKINSGLYFDPVQNGHGLSIDKWGFDNLYFSVFFSYDDQGWPEWYAGNKTKTQTGLSTGVLAEYFYDFTVDPQQQLPIMMNPNKLFNLGLREVDPVLDSNSGASFCQSPSTFESTYSIFDGNNQPIENPNSIFCYQELIDINRQPEINLSGMWFSPGDPGWGIAFQVIKRAEDLELISTLYFYDALGNPRWLHGQKRGFEYDEPFVMDMNMLRGYSRLMPVQNVEFIPAGQITVTLKPDANNNHTGTISTDVNYPGPEGGVWQRTDRVIRLFTQPRGSY